MGRFFFAAIYFTIVALASSQQTVFKDAANCGPVPKIFDPLCASDLNSYSNEFIFNCARENANGELEILKKGGTCEELKDDIELEQKERARKQNAEDIYTDVPFCKVPNTFAPVCASNGDSYKNEHLFRCVKGQLGGALTIVSQGPCKRANGGANTPHRRTNAFAFGLIFIFLSCLIRRL